jgi:hypothetical protein
LLEATANGTAVSTLTMLADAVPVFWTVTVVVAEVVPTRIEPKLIVLGFRTMLAWVPIPERLLDCGASPLTISVAV